MSRTTFFFTPRNAKTEKLADRDIFDIRRYAIVDTEEASDISIDDENNLAEVTFEGELTLLQREAVKASIINHLPLDFKGYEKPKRKGRGTAIMA